MSLENNIHEIVIEELERHFSGNASQAFYQHLDACADCRVEVDSMGELSLAFAALRVEEETAPLPSGSFYSRVVSRIDEAEQKKAWGFFSLGEVFFRRVAFASLMTLAALGSYLVTNEASYAGENAAAIMAQHDPSAIHNDGDERNYMLVTLAAYNNQ